MTLECYTDRNFSDASLSVIDHANTIIREYGEQGFVLTLRQLYYQFVARDLIENSKRSYKRLGSIVNDARMAGHISWTAIEDRTRNLEANLRLRDPADAIQTVRDQYGIDMWEGQGQRIEVWIEKEALIGVIEKVCREWDVPFFACRGYVSQSEAWRAGVRFRNQRHLILHLGDHDPSGIDMTRDNHDRLWRFALHRNVTVQRIALNMDQVEEYGPPPNFAKVTDSRFNSYLREYGSDSWELDALEPRVITALIDETIRNNIDDDAWARREWQLEDDLSKLDDIITELGAP